MQAGGDSQRQNSPADVTDSLDDVITKQTLQSVPSKKYILLANAEQKQSNSNNQNSNNQQKTYLGVPWLLGMVPGGRPSYWIKAMGA